MTLRNQATTSNPFAPTPTFDSWEAVRIAKTSRIAREATTDRCPRQGRRVPPRPSLDELDGGRWS